MLSNPKFQNYRTSTPNSSNLMDASDSLLEKKISKSLEKTEKIKSASKHDTWKWSENDLHKKRLSRVAMREQTDSFVKQFSYSPIVKTKEHLHDGSSIPYNLELWYIIISVSLICMLINTNFLKTSVLIKMIQ